MKKLFFIGFLLTYNVSNAQVHTLKESIYFGLGKSTLSNSNKAKLDSILYLLKSSKSYSGEIKGHTCNLGSSKINKVISNLRAINVMNYLVDRGAKRKSFTYSGFGSSNPQGDNQTAEGRALNRRTDVEVVLNLFDDVVSYKEDVPETKNGYRVERYKVNSNYTGLQNKSTQSNESTENIDSKTEISTAPPVELGPDFVSGKFPKVGSKLIKSTNGITLAIDKNSLVSGSSEPIDLDFKDYTSNYEIIKKGLTTSTANGKCRNLSMIGAFSTNFTQEYEELSINSTKPVVVSIPSEYFPNAKLFSNHRNWVEDTINKLSYNQQTKAYEVSVINNTQVIGVFNDVIDTPKFLKVKIKGLKPELIKPYVIYDDCNLSMCCRQNGKVFFVPIATKSNTYKIRSSYTDFSSKNGASYSVNYDIKNLDLTKLKSEVVDGIIVYKYTEKIKITNQKLDKSNVCDPVASTGN